MPITVPAGVEAVSYTHLDVYKRQLLETANERGSLVRLPHIGERAAQFAAQMAES